MTDIIAILEDEQRRTEAMRAALRTRLPRAEAVFFDNATDMIAWFKDHLGAVRLICLDHDLGPTSRRGEVIFDPGTGRDVADFLAGRRPCCPVLVHSSNVEAARAMRLLLEEHDWPSERVSPIDDLAWIDVLWLPRVAELFDQPRKE
jgi:hypothetical protein